MIPFVIRAGNDLIGRKVHCEKMIERGFAKLRYRYICSFETKYTSTQNHVSIWEHLENVVIPVHGLPREWSTIIYIRIYQRDFLSVKINQFLITEVVRICFFSRASPARSLRNVCGVIRKPPPIVPQRSPTAALQVGQGTEAICFGVSSFHSIR